MTRFEALHQWLLHRFGQVPLGDDWPRLETKAVELNKQFPDVKRTFGRRAFLSLIGFIDIRGFSERVKGKEPIYIAEYLMPFLNNVASKVNYHGGLIDKTIGDEVMFFMPNEKEEGGAPLISKSFHIISSLMCLDAELGSEYPFRIGLAIGETYLGKISSEGFSEWSIFGESVNLAKRITKETDKREKTIGAIGVLTSEVKSMECFDLLFRYMNICIEDNPVMIEIEKPTPLKGISKYRCAILLDR